MSDVPYSTTSLATAGWLWDKHGEEIIDIAGRGLAKRWFDVEWPESEANYRTHLKELYGFTRLPGNPKRIEINEIYTDVYVQDKPTAFHRIDLDELDSLPFEREKIRLSFERKPILRLAVNEQRLFILGRPGAGKTTFLKYLTLQACAGKIPKTPIFISLKELADSRLEELKPFLELQFKICKIPEVGIIIEHLLQEGAALVMFDGLDEISTEDEQRAKIIQMLMLFSKKYDKVQICVTCRVSSTDYSFTDFTHLEIADFNETQQRLFVEKWYQGEPDKRKLFLTGFEKPENNGLLKSAKTPLLFALLCLVFDETLEFPPRRVDLYKEALYTILNKWDRSRDIKRDKVYQKLSHGRKEQLLARVAAQNFEEGIYFIHEEVLVRQIVQFLQTLPTVDIDEVPEGDVVLKTIEAQHGILIKRTHNLYSFSHLTFQEYFTARYVVDHRGGAALISKHLTDESWREVFLQTASMLDNADGFFELFLKELSRWPKENPWLMELLDWIKVEAYRCKNPHPFSIKLIGLFSIEVFRALTQAITQTSEYLAYEPTYGKDFTHEITYIKDLTHELVNELSLVSTLLGALATTLLPESANVKVLAQKVALTSIPVSTLPNKLANSLANPPGSASAISRDLVLTLQKHLFVIFDFESHLVGYLNLELDEDGIIESLDSEKIKTITDYVKALQLLFDCLELAAVTEREGIKVVAAGGGIG